MKSSEESNRILNKFKEEVNKEIGIIRSSSNKIIPQKTITLVHFKNEYLEFVKYNKSVGYYKSTINAFDHVLKFFNDMVDKDVKLITLNSISINDINNFSTYLKNKAQKGFVTYLKTLKAAFNIAVEWGYLKENIFANIKLPRKENKNPSVINTTQLYQIIYRIKNETIRGIIITGYYTGLSLSVLLRLKWENINLATRTISILESGHSNKGKYPNEIPIVDDVIEVLQKRISILPLEDIGEDFSERFIFCKENGGVFNSGYISRSFKKACVSAGIDSSIHFNSLRHSFIQYMSEVYKSKLS